MKYTVSRCPTCGGPPIAELNTVPVFAGLIENEDGGLEILQMISNPQLTKQEHQTLTQEYHSLGEHVEVRCATAWFMMVTV